MKNNNTNSTELLKRNVQVRMAAGYGTEKVLTTVSPKKIIDSLMIPQFKRQQYFEGLWNGSIAITGFLEKPENKIK